MSCGIKLMNPGEVWRMFVVEASRVMPEAIARPRDGGSVPSDKRRADSDVTPRRCLREFK